MGGQGKTIECVKVDCRSLNTTVVETYVMPCGNRIRRRRCECCGELWYTAQPPEQQIDKWRLIWGERRAVGLRPLPESTENKKV
jgi:hypothetical protein